MMSPLMYTVCVLVAWVLIMGGQLTACSVVFSALQGATQPHIFSEHCTRGSSSSSSSSSHTLRLRAALNRRAILQAGPRAPKLPDHPQKPDAVQEYLAAATARPMTVISTWFVILVDPSNANVTNVTMQQVKQQVKMLNEAYRSGLPPAAGEAKVKPLWEFKLEGIKWYKTAMPLCYDKEETVKKRWASQLTKEGVNLSGTSLVIYVSSITRNCRTEGFSNVYGFSNSPQDQRYWRQYNMTYLDGVVVDTGALPGGSLRRVPGKQTGVQVVHEVGHWMGLLHPFAGGCVSNLQWTDQVLDTPAESSPAEWPGPKQDFTRGCTPRDSCPDHPGQDLTSNFMSYYNHACASSFTPGQQARMLYLWRNVRAAS